MGAGVCISLENAVRVASLMRGAAFEDVAGCEDMTVIRLGNRWVAMDHAHPTTSRRKFCHNMLSRLARRPPSGTSQWQAANARGCETGACGNGSFMWRKDFSDRAASRSASSASGSGWNTKWCIRIRLSRRWQVAATWRTDVADLAYDMGASFKKFTEQNPAAFEALAG